MEKKILWFTTNSVYAGKSIGNIYFHKPFWRDWNHPYYKNTLIGNKKLKNVYLDNYRTWVLELEGKDLSIPKGMEDLKILINESESHGINLIILLGQLNVSAMDHIFDGNHEDVLKDEDYQNERDQLLFEGLQGQGDQYILDFLGIKYKINDSPNINDLTDEKDKYRIKYIGNNDVFKNIIPEEVVSPVRFAKQYFTNSSYYPIATLENNEQILVSLIIEVGGITCFLAPIVDINKKNILSVKKIAAYLHTKDIFNDHQRKETDKQISTDLIIDGNNQEYVMYKKQAVDITGCGDVDKWKFLYFLAKLSSLRPDKPINSVKCEAFLKESLYVAKELKEINKLIKKDFKKTISSFDTKKEPYKSVRNHGIKFTRSVSIININDNMESLIGDFLNKQYPDFLK